MRKSARAAGGFHNAECRPGAPEQPQWTDQKVEGICEERWLVALNRMAHNLEYPPGYEKRERQAPIEEKQWDGKDDQRNANAMRQTIKWMPMLGFIVFDERVRHLFPAFKPLCRRHDRSP